MAPGPRALDVTEGMNEAPLELDELELPPMFGQGLFVPPGVVFGVVVPGVVLGAGVVVFGVVVVE